MKALYQLLWVVLACFITACSSGEIQGAQDSDSSDSFLVSRDGTATTLYELGVEQSVTLPENESSEEVVDTAPLDTPERILFVGNSYTGQGPVPDLVRQLAVAAGFDEPISEWRTFGGKSLRWHREDESDDNARIRIDEGWDVVVLQDFSTRPTSIGDPEGFKDDVAFFYDRALTANPDCHVILYQTWARQAEDQTYPWNFADPSEMQAQLRDNYNAAAEQAMNDTTDVGIEIAPVGDTWEAQLAGGEPPRLHDSDGSHANETGQYLNALVLFSTIYQTGTQGLPALGVSENVASELQTTVDATTGNT